MDQEIIENNKLIAEFVGYKHYPWNNPLLYSRSWDYLMYAIDRIELLGYFVMINKWTSVYTGSEQDRIQITTVEGKSKITNTFIAVVEFIKWYNQNNK